MAMITGDMYDLFFGDGFWERSYKPHIVAFADKCVDASKPSESLICCQYYARGAQCIWGLRGCCGDSVCLPRKELRGN